MALFTETPDRERNPLGGKEAAGFDQWITTTAREAAKVRKALEAAGLDRSNPMRYVAPEMDLHYNRVLRNWRDVKAGQCMHARDDLARDHFEVSLVADVMSAYGAWRYALGRFGRGGVTPGGRPVVSLESEYNRACTILSQYLGVDLDAVRECADDQAALLGLAD